MSEESKRYRSEMKAKAHRLATGDPHQRVGASSWTEAEAMNPDVQTGPRPVSKRRNYKRGGHVEGAEATHHAGKRPRRKDGGKALVRDWENADVKEANEDREGVKHEGGMKAGGRARRAGGGGLGSIMGLIPALAFQGGDGGGQAPYSPPGASAKKAGGRAKRAVGGGSELAALLPGGLQQGNIPTSRFNFQNGPSQVSRAAGLKKGGDVRPHRDTGGGATYKEQFSHQDGGRDPRARGGKLDAKERDDLPKREFGEPGSRKYPMPDKSHAANAKARASEMEHKGRLSKGEEEKIDAKADRVLHRAKGGKAGKMSVNIVIAPGGQHPQAAPPPMAGPAPPPMPPPRPPMPPPGMMPPGAPPGMAMGPGGPPPMMPPPRKRGGRAPDGGAGGGLGRLEKIEDYGDRAREGEARR